MARSPRTFLEHIRELRLRIVFCVAYFLAGGGLGYGLHEQILGLLHQPLHQTLYYTSPAGAFNLAMKVSILVGVVFLLPTVLYNVIAFIQPALKKRLEKSELRLMSGLSLLTAAGGALFAYYVVVPMSLRFFATFDQRGFQSLISATDYVDFVINCLLIFVIIFQLPLFLFFIDRVQPLPPKRLLHYERHVVVGSLVVALILPFTYDPLTQFLVAIPIILLYNLSILLVAWSHHHARRFAPAFVPIGSVRQAVAELSAVPADVPAASSANLAPVAAAAPATKASAPVSLARPNPARQAAAANFRRRPVMNDLVGRPVTPQPPISRSIRIKIANDAAADVSPQSIVAADA